MSRSAEDREIYVFNRDKLHEVRAECKRLGITEVTLIKFGQLWIEAALTSEQAKVLASLVRKA